MKIAIGSDHRGLHKKEVITAYLASKDITVIDVGSFGTEKANHVIYGIKAAEKVLVDCTFGIVICGSGIGISIAANKVKGIRCALVATKEQAVTTRAHNNANVLALCESISDEEALAIVDAFITSPFLGGVYQERIEVLDKYEKKGSL